MQEKKLYGYADDSTLVALVHYYYYYLKRALFLGPVFFQTALTRSVVYDLNRGGMPFHNAVGVNREKGATTENQGTGVKYMG